MGLGSLDTAGCTSEEVDRAPREAAHTTLPQRTAGDEPDIHQEVSGCNCCFVLALLLVNAFG